MFGPPAELVFGGILVMPMLLIVVIGLVVTLLVTNFLNKKRLSRFFWYPPLAFVALWIFFSAIIGLIFIPT